MDVIFAIVCSWIVGCLIAGAIANNKGLSAPHFFFLSIFCSPLLGIVFAVIAKPDARKLEEQQLRSGYAKMCPYCAELIKREAMACRYCGRDLESNAGARPANLAPDRKLQTRQPIELKCSCPDCAQRILVSTHLAGNAVTCPSCGIEFTIPTPA